MAAKNDNKASKDCSLVSMLLFTRSTRIRRANVGSHAIVFKSLCFGPFILKRNPGVFKLKRGLQHFRKSLFSRFENAGVV